MHRALTGATMFSGILAPETAMPWVSWKWCAEIDPFPCSVIRSHRPELPNLGDVNAQDFAEKAAKYGPIDLLVAGAPCFPAGTLIFTKRGLVPIEEVRVTDSALTHKARWRKVLRTGSSMAETVVLRGQGHWGLETTSEHPFYSRTSKISGWKRDSRGKAHPKRQFSKSEWTPAKDMKGRFWASPSQFPAETVNVPGEGLQIDPTLLWLAGLWVGDGWIRDGQRSQRPAGQTAHQVIICCGHAEVDEFEKGLAATPFHWIKTRERTTFRFTCNSNLLMDWLATNFSRGAHNKRLPVWIFGAEEPLRTAFIRGYLDSDGSADKHAKTFASVSRHLAIGIKLLLQTTGHGVGLYRVEPREGGCVIEGRRVTESPYFQIRQFHRSRSSIEIDGQRYGLVRKYHETGEVKEVFNLEVEEDNSYVADGIIVHNCQDFSVAGQRTGMDGARGNLSLRFVELVGAIRPRWLLFENVPGLLSSTSHEATRPSPPPDDLQSGEERIVEDDYEADEGSDFGYFLSALLELGYSLAYTVLDAQYFGLAQRRKRVFVVGSLGDWRGPSAVLFDLESLSGNPAPSREAGQGVTGTLSARTKGGGGLGTDFDIGGGLVGPADVTGTLIAIPILESGARTGKSTDDPRVGIGIGENGDPMFTLQAGKQHAIAFCAAGQEVYLPSEVSPPLCNTDGGQTVPTIGFYPTGGTHGVSACFELSPAIKVGTALDIASAPAIAFSQKDHGVDACEDLSPTLRGMGHDHSHANGGGQLAVAFQERGRDGSRNLEHQENLAYSLNNPGAGDRAHERNVLTPAMAVRRLTPLECTQLQGFPSWFFDFDHVLYRGKPPADGPIYRALGNAMAVPVIAWIGKRIAQVDAILFPR